MDDEGIYRIALSALQDKPAVPDGWKLVPITANMDTVNAGYRAIQVGCEPEGIFADMISASSTPGGELD